MKKEGFDEYLKSKIPELQKYATNKVGDYRFPNYLDNVISEVKEYINDENPNEIEKLTCCCLTKISEIRDQLNLHISQSHVSKIMKFDTFALQVLDCFTNILSQIKALKEK